MSLEGQAAVVTGASRGIGRAIAEEFARAGADLVVNYHKTPAQDLVDFVAGLGRKAVAVQADVSKVADCERLVDEAMKAFGKIDVLVNNAGITRDTLLMRMDEEAWDTVLDTNLKSAYATCKAASKHMMKARTGSIINVSSVSGLMGLAGQANYAASKAGLIGFTKTIARELAPRGIRANVIAPGFITSDMTATLDDKMKEQVLGQIPLKRYGEPVDIANAALYLASDLSSYVTGTTLIVSGGMVM
ncbi:MAG: 3-oxoacyl-[acyl-carrier-protein] reductase [Candidatus Sumerlaeaceae bacterium]